MLPAEQERLFKQLRKLRPLWTPAFTSGIVHGYKDEVDLGEPRPGMVRGAMQHDEYALGYLAGFASRRGEDAAAQPWHNLIYTVMPEVPSGLV